MPLRNRHKGADFPECPMGSDGPFLNDAMIEFACKLVHKMQESVRKKHKIEIGFTEGEGDINAKAFGGITYVYAMAKYIEELEAELKKGPILGVEDLGRMEKRSIHTVTPDKIIFEGGSMLFRNGLNWEWGVNKD
jgi:hypothetical protein